MGEKPARDLGVHKTCFPCHEPAKAHDFVYTRYSPSPRNKESEGARRQEVGLPQGADNRTHRWLAGAFSKRGPCQLSSRRYSGFLDYSVRGARCRDAASKMLAGGSVRAQKCLLRKDVNLARAA